MIEIIYIIGMACATVLLINAVPFRNVLTFFRWQDKKVFNCALCFGFYVSIAITIVSGLELILIPIAAVLASFIDKKLYE